MITTNEGDGMYEERQRDLEDSVLETRRCIRIIVQDLNEVKNEVAMSARRNGFYALRINLLLSINAVILALILWRIW